MNVREKRLSIEVTTRCNRACFHCFVRAGLSEESSLPLELVREILTEGFQTGYRHLHLTGGEPLLWEGLMETLDYALGLGYKTVFLNTEGTLLTKDMASKLAAYDGLAVSVSLEGSKTLHNNLREEGSYPQIVRGVEKALEVGMDLCIFTIACKSLLPFLPDFAKDLYQRFPAMAYLALIPLVRVPDDSFAFSNELLEPEDFLQLVRTVSLLNLYGLKTQVLNNPLVNVLAKQLEMPWIPQSRPLYHDGSVMIMANRNIGLSHSSRESFGKYEPGMIQETLTSEDYRNAVAPDATICPSCNYAERCMEYDMLKPSERYKDMHPQTPYCKKVLDLAGS